MKKKTNKILHSLLRIKRLVNVTDNVKYYICVAFIAGTIKYSAPLIITSVTSQVVDSVLLNDSLTSAERAMLLMRYVFLVIAIFLIVWAPSTYFRQYLTELITVKITSKLRSKLSNHIFSLPFYFFQRKQSGEINTIIISDINAVANLVSGGLVYIWIDLSSIFITTCLIVYENPLVGGTSVLSLPVYLYLMRYFRGIIKNISCTIQNIQGEFSDYIHDRLSNIDSVKNYNAQNIEEKNAHNIINRYEKEFLKRSKIKSLNLLVMGQLTQLPSVIILAFGGYEVIYGKLSVGSFIAITMYIRQIFWPLDRVAEFNINLAAATASLDRIYQILNVTTECELYHCQSKFPDKFNAISFKDVSVSYASNNKPILSNISFSINKGEVLAIAGPSGSGKTTLARLLERSINCNTGEICIDNTNINKIKLTEYRKNIKIVPQNPVLFSDTIAMNISYPNKEIPINQLYNAAIKSGSLSFILKCPEKFDYHVGERGNFLSGGQRQRLAIARALAAKGHIYIFDESTASLDTESERAFYEMIRELRLDNTIIIIAHRPAVFDLADRVILINNGKLEADGSPEYLKIHSPLFRKLTG